VRATGALFAACALASVACAADAARPSRSYRLDNPAQVLLARGGALLVAERGSRNRILRVDPGTGAFRVFSTGVPSPWGLGYARDGALLVSSTRGLYRLVPGRRPRKLSSTSMSPFVVLRDGRVAFASETAVGILPARGGRPRLLRVDVEFVHGLALLPGGDLAVSDTGNRRLLRVDPASGRSSVITTALRTPLGLVAAPDGSLLAVEFDSGSIVRVDAGGGMTTVARELLRPYALTRAADGTLYVTEAGEPARATGALVRVAPDGAVTRIRLRRG
jgi:sugar lactone lactonase YvrE